MDPTWTPLIRIAAWVFLAGTLLVTASALPAVGKRGPRVMAAGFVLALLSFVLVLAAWVLPRLL